MDGRGLHPRQPNRRPLLREYRRRFYRRAGMTGTNMTRYPIVAAALFFIFPTAPALASGPSFDCAKDRKSLVSGRSVAVRVELGGRPILQKKKKATDQYLH